ncbi:MAG: iron uptake porin [Phormidesmis sp.]
MKQVIWKSLLAATPTALVMAWALPGNVLAAETISSELYSEPQTALPLSGAAPVQIAQVTSVSELSDVQPGDWAYTALQRLVEEYGCLEGYPDRTYRGNRALTRYEFAAGLNACLDVVVQLIGSGSQLDEIRRLQEEFAAELATVRGDVDALQTDVAELEANQFSTTTKLNGNFYAHLIVPFDDADGFIDDVQAEGSSLPAPAGNQTGGGPEADATFEYAALLNFDTSFTGKDRLNVRLLASDSPNTLANTESGLNYQYGRRSDLEDNVGLDNVYYIFPVGNRISATVGANSVDAYELVTSTIVPFADNAVGFAGSPEFYILYPTGNFGAAVNLAFTRNLVLDVGYASTSSNVNTPDGGLFNDNYYMAQLNFLTDGILDAAITYMDGSQDEDGTADNTIAGLLSLNLGRFTVAGHYASTSANGGGDLDSYMGGVAISDLFGVGNELGVYGGISPALNRDPLLVEAYYKINVNEFFSLTPAVIYADNDSGVGNQENLYGVLRTSFSF